MDFLWRKTRRVAGVCGGRRLEPGMAVPRLAHTWNGGRTRDWPRGYICRVVIQQHSRRLEESAVTIAVITPWLNHPELVPAYEAAVTGARAIIVDQASDADTAAALAAMVE